MPEVRRVDSQTAEPRKTALRPQSAKAKGRRLQQEVRDAVLAAFPQLEPDDVRSTSMGASGADLLLSPAARKMFPFVLECKNQEALNIWAALMQAEGHAEGVAPALVFKRNHSPTYIALQLPDFLELAKKAAANG
jgi:hypothetical protein